MILSNSVRAILDDIFKISLINITSNNESEFRTTQQVDQVPGDIDSLKHYKVKHENTSTMLAKSRDGTKWKRDSHTNWKNFETVCYKDCNRSLFYANPNCFYLQEYTRENVIHFDKKGNWGICGASGVFNTCEARKYTSFKENIQLLKHIFFMLDDILLYQKVYVSNIPKL